MASINHLYRPLYTSTILDSTQILTQILIQERRIEWLCHFTPRANLENIKRLGLKPKELLLSNEVLVTDQRRYDRYNNAICLSISKPNKWMFQHKQEQGFDLCLLLINPRVLYEKECLFYPHNAATASYRTVSDEDLKGAQALEKLFAPHISFQKSGKEPQTIWRKRELEPCETTSDQAEVQCLDVIEPEYIEHIFEYNPPIEYSEIKSVVGIDNVSNENLINIMSELFSHNEITDSACISENTNCDKTVTNSSSSNVSLSSFGKNISKYIENRETDRRERAKKEAEYFNSIENDDTEIVKSADKIHFGENRNPEVKPSIREILKQVEYNPQSKTISSPEKQDQVFVNKDKAKNKSTLSTSPSSANSDPEGCLYLILIVFAILLFKLIF